MNLKPETLARIDEVVFAGWLRGAGVPMVPRSLNTPVSSMRIISPRRTMMLRRPRSSPSWPGYMLAKSMSAW